MLNQKLSLKIEKDNFIGYILPDGNFFNLLKNGFHTHTSYEHYLIKEKLLDKSTVLGERQLTNLNQWIRVNDGTNVPIEVLAELPIKEITEEQYKALFEFIDYLRTNGKTFIEIGCEEHSRGVHFTDKSLWYHKFDLTKDSNAVIEYFIRDAYRIYKEYGE